MHEAFHIPKIIGEKKLENGLIVTTIENNNPENIWKKDPTFKTTTLQKNNLIKNTLSKNSKINN